MEYLLTKVYEVYVFFLIKILDNYIELTNGIITKCTMYPASLGRATIDLHHALLWRSC